jgi:Protein of unknown function (DUF4231)
MSEVQAVDEMPGDEPTGITYPESPTWARLEDQIAWYDGRAENNQRWFKGLKVCQLVAAAAIPVGAAAGLSEVAVGAGGAFVVVLEGFQQLQQYHENWINYRSVCERLKHEKFLFPAGARPYAGVPNPERLLAERVEDLVSQEQAGWVTHRAEELSEQTQEDEQ